MMTTGLKMRRLRGWAKSGRGLWAVAALLGFSSAVTPTALAGVQDRPFFRAKSVVIVFGADDFAESDGKAPIVYDFYMLDNLGSGVAGNDIIEANGRPINFNTGRYNPIESGDDSGWEFQINDPTSGGEFNSVGPHQTLNKNDSYNAFGLDEDTDIDLLGGGGRASRFFVASNVAFDVYGEAGNLETSGDFTNLDYSNIRYRLRYNVSGGNGVNRWGQRAQDPAEGGEGVVLGHTNAFTLDDLDDGPVKVFDGGSRTASQKGSIMEQAIGFQSRYNLRGAGVNGNNYDFSQGVGTISAEITYTVYTP